MKLISVIILLVITFYNCRCQKVDYDSIDQVVFRMFVDRFSENLNKVLPDIELMDVKGNTKKISEFKTKVLIIEIWATWCGSCVGKIPYQKNVMNLLKKNGIIDYEWIKISIDTDTASWKKMIYTKDIPGINLLGHPKEIEKHYKLRGAPHYILVDKNLTVIGFNIFGPTTLLFDYLLIRGIEGTNCADSYREVYIENTRQSSKKYKDWLESYDTNN